MSHQIPLSARAHGITINVAALRTLLFRAYYLAQQAHSFAAVGHCQAAIGSMAGLDILLRDCAAFYRATMALHSSSHLSTEGMPRGSFRQETRHE